MVPTGVGGQLSETPEFEVDILSIVLRRSVRVKRNRTEISELSLPDRVNGIAAKRRNQLSPCRRDVIAIDSTDQPILIAPALKLD